MQYLKDSVKESIIKAALKEFNEKGYRNSSMRAIARNAGIVSGNIYRYFENKETLFNYIEGPVYEKISDTIDRIKFAIQEFNGPWDDKQVIAFVKHLCNQFLKAISGYDTELLILLDKSSGSIYENTKKELVLQIQKIIGLRQVPGAKEKDPFVLYVLASAYVEGVCVVLRDSKGRDKKAVIESLSGIMLGQISKRI